MADENDSGEVRVTIDNKSNSGPAGAITLGPDVVATIAGLAARDVPGIYEIGRGRFLAIGDSPDHGVEAEVGTKQAAFDLDVVIEYGSDIRVVANELRQRIAREVDKMAGREVVEVNINVVGLHFPEAAEPEQPKPKANPRVI